MAMRNALVLSGGGAWGSWQVGACEHLVLERGLWFDVISGVSVGAINGAALAHGHDRNGLQAHFRRLRDWWFAVRGNHNVYRRRPNAALGMALGRWDRLFDVAPLRDEVLGREIDPVQVAASPGRLCVGYVDLRTRRYEAGGWLGRSSRPGCRPLGCVCAWAASPSAPAAPGWRRTTTRACATH